jgi:hypothetical protein
MAPKVHPELPASELANSLLDINDLTGINIDLDTIKLTWLLTFDPKEIEDLFRVGDSS